MTTAKKPPKIGRNIDNSSKSIFEILTSRFQKEHIKRKVLLLIIVSFLASLVLIPTKEVEFKKYKVGDIASENIKAPKNLTIVDKRATERKKQKAAEAVSNIFDYDGTVKNSAENTIGEAFKFIRPSSTTYHRLLLIKKNSNAPQTKSEIQKLYNNVWDKKTKFEELLGIYLTDDEFKILFASNFTMLAERALKAVIKDMLDGMITSDKSIVDSSVIEGISLRTVGDEKEQLIKRFTNFSLIIDVDMAKQKIREHLSGNNYFAQAKEELKPIILSLAEKLIKPNVYFNKKDTLAAQQAAMDKVENETLTLSKGEIIVRHGDRINEGHVSTLEAIQSLKGEAGRFESSVGLFLFVVIFLTIVHIFASKFISRYDPSFKDLVLVSVIFILTIALHKIANFTIDSIYENYASIPYECYQYGIPLFAAPMILALVLNTNLAALFGIASITTIGVAGIFDEAHLNISIFLFAYFLIGSFFSINRMPKANKRTHLLKAGFLMGIVNTMVAFVILLITKKVSSAPTELPYTLFFAFGSGITSSILAIGITPIIELFGYTTDFKLIELANTEHPLLTRLAIEAPGTYHHSFLVSRLAEAAAEAIGISHLLTKVACLYHDIGKIDKAPYFIENQQRNDNKHEKLTPRMSSIILVGHIKDGVELAKKHKLPDSVIELISEHHGTSLISFFYSKAKEIEDPEVDEVKENDYRYPGPKPKSKEAGIMMLADATEAASRSLSEPSIQRLKGVVDTIINKAFSDGQLDECRLNFRELSTIANCFANVLTTSIFHRRIDYPTTDIKKTVSNLSTNGNNNSK